ncbi:hypothetical protein H1R20_g12525, partial [Candolleomyces eurysporus]
MANKLPDGALEPWQPAVHEASMAVEANARYFTPASSASSQDIVDFAPFVDPTGQMRGLMEGDYVHTTDNRVDYMEIVTSSDGKTQYRAVDPVTFRIGDIVEATVSFAAMPTRNGSAKLHVLLRALVLLDHSERDKAAILRMRQRYYMASKATGTGATDAPPPLKRRSTYYIRDEDETDSTERKFQRMSVDTD